MKEAIAETKAAAGPHEIYVARARALRGRFIAGFLLLNWGIMGWFTIRAPALWSALLTLTLGLLAFVGGLTQLRAARRASDIPLIRFTNETFNARTYTRSDFSEFPWSRMRLNANAQPSKGARPPGDYVEVSVGDDRVAFFGWPQDADGAEDRSGVDAIAPRLLLNLWLLEKSDRKTLTDRLQRLRPAPKKAP